MARDPATLCFDLLLSNVLDFCLLEELLLCVMPVCRSWRSQSIDHPLYWASLMLFEVEGSDCPERSETVFLLRLSRTRARPIRVDISLQDPHNLLPVLAEHLHHICVLSMDCPPSATEAILQAFRARPAPLLSRLSFSFLGDILVRREAGSITVPSMPTDLFASHAPALRYVDVPNVALPAGADFPGCLSNVTQLVYQFLVGVGPAPVGAPLRVLPDISAHLPRLQQLTVGPHVVFAAPAFWRAETWRRVRAVTFLEPKLWDGRSVSALPLGAVPRIMMHSIYPPQTDHSDVIGLLAAALPGPVDVAIPWGSLRAPRFCSLRWRMTAPQNARVERWVYTLLPRRAQDARPFDRLCALQEAPLAGRVVRLSLSLADWDILVGGGHFVGGFAALETLVLALATDPSNSFWRTDAGAKPSQLFCPRLHRLALTHACTGRFPRDVDIGLIATFVRESLPDARLPLVLELKEVDLDGTYAEYPDLFSSVVLSVRDPTDNAKWE